MNKQVRMDLYYGWKSEKGPIDREQFFFNPETDDVDEFVETVRECVEDILADLMNEGDEDEANQS